MGWLWRRARARNRFKAVSRGDPGKLGHVLADGERRGEPWRLNPVQRYVARMSRNSWALG